MPADRCDGFYQTTVIICPTMPPVAYTNPKSYFAEKRDFGHVYGRESSAHGLFRAGTISLNPFTGQSLSYFIKIVKPSNQLD